MVKEICTVIQLQAVLINTKFVVIDFYADWCGPCKVFAPKFDKYVEKYPDIGFYKINVENSELAQFVHDCKIECMPTFCYFENGNIIGSTLGPKELEITKTIDDYYTRQCNLMQI